MPGSQPKAKFKAKFKAGLKWFGRNWYWIVGGIGLLVGVVVFLRWDTHRKRKLHQARTLEACAQIPAKETIFVSVASYRDDECPYTVFDCLEKAYCPKRVFIGVCQQNEPGDIDTFQRYRNLAKRKGTADYSQQIRVYDMKAQDAKGPMYARAMVEEHLYRDETFYLVVDSHTVFTQDWDKHCLEQWRECLAYSEKPILTMYPSGFEKRRRLGVLSHPDRAPKPKPPSFLRVARFNQRTYLPELAGPVMKDLPKRCYPTAFWAGCFSFGSADRLKEVPFDPNYAYVFQGEEIAMSARYWTAGYDLFSPRTMLVFHMWERRRPTFWEQFLGPSPEHRRRRREETDGYRRLRVLFRTEVPHAGDLPLGAYGLGTQRSLTDYEQHCGVNFLLSTAAPHAQVGCIGQKPSPEEILTKFGSLARFNTALAAAAQPR